MEKKFIPVLIASVLIFGSYSVKALTPEEKTQEREQRMLLKNQRETEKTEKTQAKEAKKLATCTEVASKITNRKTQVEKSITNYSSSISRIETTLNARIQELKTAGKDTSEIEANLAKFKSDAQALISQRQSLLSQIQNIDASNCQTNKQAFVTNVKNFNATLKTLVQSQNNLKKYLRDNVVAKIKALKETTNVQQ